MKRIGLSIRISLLLRIVLFVLVSVTSASGGDDNASNQGKRLYTQKCQLCHGLKGNGDGPAAAAFNPGPADFAAPSFWETYDEKAITGILEKGRGQMPAFGLTSEETQAIINYMSHTFKPGR
jgi:mono/diheme cytochrome c family protein